MPTHPDTSRFALPVLLSAAVLAGASFAAADQPMIGQPAPGFALSTIDGGHLDLADLRGKTVVLHFGAGW